MYHFLITYEKGFAEYDHINRVEYTRFSLDTVVEGDDILKHRFPLETNLYLFSDESTYSVSAKGITSIQVDKES